MLTLSIRGNGAQSCEIAALLEVLAMLLNVTQMPPTKDLAEFGKALAYDICELPGARASAATKRGLEYTSDVKAATDHLYQKVKGVITPEEWPAFAPLIAAINELKKERDAVILAHNYMTAEIFNCVGDYRGDSLGLAREAAKVDAKVIVQAGVHFMAETSKILSPNKTVLIPDTRAGCSLAASITGADVRLIKQRYPGLPVITYVNTTADVKAESDICCTSANATQVVETIGALIASSCCLMSFWPKMLRPKLGSKSTPGKANAKSTNALQATTSTKFARAIQVPLFWPTQNARPTLLRLRTSQVRRGR
jgi:hypothetical protein